MNRLPGTMVVGALAVLAAAAPLCAQNLHKSTRRIISPIADLRAQGVGDILTITIEEQTKVRNEDKVDRTNRSSLAAQLNSFTLSDKTFKTNVLPEFDVRQSRSFEALAKQEKDSKVTSSIAVMVVDVMPNGNLVVAGNRTLIIDDETKIFRLTGIVRPHDISTTNTISSTQVADARISLVGSGGNSRFTTKGPVGVFFDTLMWAAWPF